MQITRRGFFYDVAALSALQRSGAAADAQWWMRPMRAFHPNMREIDVRGLDARKFIADCKITHCDSVFVSAGGIYAFYPSEVKYHYVSKFLDGRDFLKQAVDAGHEAGLKMIARVDFSKAREPVFRDHPEWFARKQDGSPVASRGFYETCPNSPYRNEAFAAPVIREILTRCAVDGFHLNAGGFPGYCYCGNCQEKFRKSFGRALPLKPDWSSQEWKQFMAWRYDCNAGNFAFCHRVMLDTRKDVFWTGELAGLDDPTWIRNRAYDIVRLADGCSSLMSTIDNLAPAIDMRWAAGMTAKYVRTVGGRPPILNLKAQVRDGGWPRASAPLAEYAMWGYQSIANGAGLKMPLFGIQGKSEDERNVKAIAEIFGVLERHAWVYDDAQPVAPIALVWSQQTFDMYGEANPAPRYAENFWGLYAALVESHLQFDVIGDGWLNEERLNHFQCLVLPNTACLSEAQANAIAAFVRKGGGLVATFRSSLYDQTGNRRNTFGLEAAFGARPRANPGKYLTSDDQVVRSGYLCLQQTHEAIRSMRQTTILPLAFGVSPVDTLPGAVVPLVLGYHENPGIPEEIDNPVKTPLPACVVNAFGSGRVVYFPAEVDKFYWQRKMSDHRQLLESAVLWGLGRPPVLETDAPGLVELTVYQKEGHIFVHFVNAVGRVPLDGIVEVRDIKTSLALPGSGAIRRASTLLSGDQVRFELLSGRVEFTLPRLGPYEVVVLEKSQKPTG